MFLHSIPHSPWALVCVRAVTLIVRLMKLISSGEMTHQLQQNPEAGDLSSAQIYFLSPPVSITQNPTAAASRLHSLSQQHVYLHTITYFLL